MSEAPRLVVVSAPDAAAERQYTYRSVFEQALGIAWRWEPRDDAHGTTTLRLDGHAGALGLPDVVFPALDAQGLQSSLWRAEHSPTPWAVSRPDTAIADVAPLPFGAAGRPDVLGSIFFVLTGLEEAVVRDRDRHDRLVASASWLGRHGLLARAIVDEWTDALFAALQAQWPVLRRRAPAPSIHVSCDVDNPFAPYVGRPLFAARVALADVVKRRRPLRAMQTLGNLALSAIGRYGLDPNHRFAWLMRENERRGLRVTFYFIAGGEQPGIDGYADLDTPRLRRVLAEIHARGHRIGLHGSYATYRDAARLGAEAERLHRIAERAGVTLDELPARQHYLRWDALETPRVLEAAGVTDDSSVAFAAQLGFRAGTTRPFDLFDLRGRRATRVREVPLQVMDTTLCSPDYLGLPPDEALAATTRIIETVERHGGTLTLLWHNDSFQARADDALYRAVLDRAVSGSLRR